MNAPTRTQEPHPHADILRAIAEGRAVQFRYTGSSIAPWRDPVDANDTLQRVINVSLGTNAGGCEYEFRTKPRTITINGHEVPEPLREMPPPGTIVYWPYFGPDLNDKGTHMEVSGSNRILPVMLLQGVLHLTSEAARAHRLALISLTAK